MVSQFPDQRCQETITGKVTSRTEKIHRHRLDSGGNRNRLKHTLNKTHHSTDIRSKGES